MPTRPGFRFSWFRACLASRTSHPSGSRPRKRTALLPLAESSAPENTSVPEHAPQGGMTEHMASSKVPGTLFLQPRLAAHRGVLHQSAVALTREASNQAWWFGQPRWLAELRARAWLLAKGACLVKGHAIVHWRALGSGLAFCLLPA